MSEITMGEATREAQGYPTQVWLPINPRPGARDAVALLHDRTGELIQPDVFVIPGNRIGKLFTPGSEQYTLKENGSGNVRRLRIPDSVLWANHGGPCESRGAEYQRISEGIMSAVYELLRLHEAPVVIPGKKLGTQQDYRGPFDYVVPLGPLGPSERPRLQLMDIKLLPDWRRQSTKSEFFTCHRSVACSNIVGKNEQRHLTSNCCAVWV